MVGNHFVSSKSEYDGESLDRFYLNFAYLADLVYVARNSKSKT